MVLPLLSAAGVVRGPHAGCGLQNHVAFSAKCCEVLQWRRISYWIRWSFMSEGYWLHQDHNPDNTHSPQTVAFPHLWISFLGLSWHSSRALHSTFLVMFIQVMITSFPPAVGDECPPNPEGILVLGKCSSGSRLCYSFVAQPKGVMRVCLSLLSVAAGTDKAGDKMVFSCLLNGKFLIAVHFSDCQRDSFGCGDHLTYSWSIYVKHWVP